MATKLDFIEAVERMLAASKTIVNVDVPPTWMPNRDGSGQEAKLHVALDGVMYGNVLIVVCKPATGAFHFSLTHSNICISRLDYDEDGGHTNTLHALELGLPLTVSGKHFHRWSLNTKLVSANGSLERLENAEELPVSLRNFHASFRWFCDELKIFLPHDHEITPPRFLL